MAASAAAVALLGGLVTVSLALAAPAGPAAFGAVTPSATDDTAASNADVLGVSQSAPADQSTDGPAVSATSQALNVNVASCSESDLQAAIGTVATAGGTVTLRSGCIYTLTDAVPPNGDNGLPVITNNVTINGVGDTITRDSGAANFRFFEVDGPSGSLTLNSLTLSHGHASTAYGNGRGGAIFLSGAGPALVVNNSTLTTNTADAFGGAIDNERGSVRVSSTTLTNNTAGNAGGAVFVSPFGGSGTATFQSSKITANHATVLAGGIAAAVGTTVTLSSTSITGNAVTGSNPEGGGIAQGGTVTLNTSAVSGNTVTGPNARGGGILSIGGTVRLNSSAVNGNTVNGSNSRGGGIFTSSGTVALTSSKVSDNQALGAGAQGGGIFRVGGTVTLTNSAVSGNMPDNCGSPSTVTGCA